MTVYVLHKDFETNEVSYLFIVALMIDSPVRLKAPTLSTVSPSQILFIENLTRPFTIHQLKVLLLKYGKFGDDEFWHDRFKSRCFVKVSVIALSISIRLC
jgi:hypothetical protein